MASLIVASHKELIHYHVNDEYFRSFNGIFTSAKPTLLVGDIFFLIPISLSVNNITKNVIGSFDDILQSCRTL